MRLTSDEFHMTADELRDLTVDVLGWLAWRAEAGADGRIAAADQDGRQLEVSVEQRADASRLAVDFAQGGDDRAAILLDEVHAAAFKRSLSASGF
jgi:hypothetical protein